MRILIQEAKLHLDTEDMGKVFACAMELAHMCRLASLGLEGEHPILASTFPPPGGTGFTSRPPAQLSEGSQVPPPLISTVPKEADP